MQSDIHTRSGTLVGFHDGDFIYDLRGRAVGQLRGSHAYCMAGHYVGELHDRIIIDKNCHYGSIGAYVALTRGQRKMGRAGRTLHRLPKYLSSQRRSTHDAPRV